MMPGPCRVLMKILAGLPLCVVLSNAQADETLLFDDFDGSALDTSVWGLANWTIGDRTQFGNSPQFFAGNPSYVALPLDTFNPGSPGALVLGTEIYSLENFERGEGVEYTARARLASETPGLVAAFFTYNQQRKRGKWISDEIDFEVLSKQDLDRVLVTSWDDWGSPGSDYEDGEHHLGAYLDLSGFDWRDWNTYAMRWFPDRVEWWINEVLVHVQTAPVPNLAQPVRASLWAGGTTWPDAFDPAISPVLTAQQNTRHEWHVDWIMVTRLGDEGGGNGGQGPAAPSGLSATVNGNQVQLNWSDQSNNEDGFRVFRADKPKGNVQANFNLVGVAGPNTGQYSESATDGRYLYFVTAYNAQAESSPSNSINVRVGSGGPTN